MFVKILLFVVWMGLSVGCSVAGEFVRVTVETENLPPAMRFVGGLVAEHLAERTEVATEGTALHVRYAIDPSVPDGEAFVCVKGDVAEIRAARLRGLVHGSGRLLKAISYGAQTFEIQDGRYDFRPAKALRMADLEKHFFNGYISMPRTELLRYIDDLALDGINGFLCPIGVVPVDEADLSEDEKASVRANGQAYARRIAQLDCGFVNDCGANQLPVNAPKEFLAEPNTNLRAPSTGFNGCPAKPAALRAMITAQEKTMAELKDVAVTGFTYWPYDEGGCGCVSCRPWGCNGFIRLCEKFRDVNQAAKPGALSILGTWFFDDVEYEGLWKYLETHDWVDYLLVDDFGAKYPEYPLRHPIPNKRTKIITFPEISMWGRIPWGGYGAIAMPRFFTSLFRQCERIVDGFEYYSEGIYEDINKAVVTGLYIDPSRTADDILREYGAYHFVGASPDDFVELANLLETNHRSQLMTFENVTRAFDLAKQMDAAMLPRLKTSWRWRLIWLRTAIDREICRTGDVSPESAYVFFDEIVKICHLERQRQWVWDGMLGGWTCPRYFPKGAAKSFAPPQGDATKMLQTLVDEPRRVFVRLGKGEWRVGDLRLGKSRFELVLEDGCRLSGRSLKVGTGVDGVTVRGEGSALVDMPVMIEGSTNVVVRGVAVRDGEVNVRKSAGVVVDLPPSGSDCPRSDRGEAIRRLDERLEWSDQRMEYEKVERLQRELRDLLKRDQGSSAEVGVLDQD